MTPPTSEQLLHVYRRMCDALRDVDKERNERAEGIYHQMHTIETSLIAQLRETKDMQGLIAFYTSGRDELDAIDTQYKRAKQHVMLRQEKLEDAMFALLRETNVESMKTSAGTAFTSTQTSVKIADWRVFLGEIVSTALHNALEEGWSGSNDLINKVLEDDAWALLKRAASKDAVKAYIEENKRPVPGVDFDQRLAIGVRRK